MPEVHGDAEGIKPVGKYSTLHMKGLHELLLLKKQFKHQPYAATFKGETYKVRSVQDYLKIEWAALNDEISRESFNATPARERIEQWGREIIEKQWYVSFFDNTLIHYYVDTEDLCAFLCKTAVRDFSAVRKATEESPSRVIEFNLSRAVQTFDGNTVQAGDHQEFYLFGAIHQCRSEHSVAFAIRKTTSSAWHLLLHYGTGWGSNCLDDDFYKIKSEDHATNGGHYTESCNLIVNLFLYAAAFPDMIRSGVPDDSVLSYNATRHQSRTIKTAEEIIDRTGVTPHFRRGHFRLLASEHWTPEKRGQIVFVRSTFVKGHAETAEDIGPEREEMNR